MIAGTEPDKWAQLVAALQQIAQHLTPDPWSKWLAIGTFSTFAATAVMAWKTAQLAKDTVDAAVIADIHHQESQSGFVIWNGLRRIDFSGDGIAVRGYLKNVGPGAALSVTIWIIGPGDPPTTTGVSVGSLGSGAEFPADRQQPFGVLWNLPMGDSPQRKALENPSFQVSYDTIYDRKRTTRYPLGSISTDNAGTHYGYTQEFIDLNRDPRIADLSRAPRSFAARVAERWRRRKN